MNKYILQFQLLSITLYINTLKWTMTDNFECHILFTTIVYFAGKSHGNKLNKKNI